MIFIYFFGVIKMFSGFKSRWRTPFLDMYLTALRIWRRMIATSSLWIKCLFYFFFLCEMYCYNDDPSTFYNTKYKILSSSYTPYSLAIFSWSKSRNSFISFSNAALSFGFSILYFIIFFAAKILPDEISFAK